MHWGRSWISNCSRGLMASWAQQLTWMVARLRLRCIKKETDPLQSMVNKVHILRLKYSVRIVRKAKMIESSNLQLARQWTLRLCMFQISLCIRGQTPKNIELARIRRSTEARLWKRQISTLRSVLKSERRRGNLHPWCSSAHTPKEKRNK